MYCFLIYHRQSGLIGSGWRSEKDFIQNIRRSYIYGEKLGTEKSDPKEELYTERSYIWKKINPERSYS